MNYYCKLFPFCVFTGFHGSCILYELNNKNILLNISVMVETGYPDYESFIQSCYSFFNTRTIKDFKRMA